MCYYIKLQAFISCCIFHIALIGAVEFTDVRVKFNDHKVTERLEMFMVEYKGRNRINGTVMLAIELPHINVQLSIDVLNEKNKSQRVISLNIDGCKFLEGEYKNRMTRFVYESLLKSATWHRKCPLRAHDPFKFEYFDVDMHGLPEYIPNMTFVTKVNTFQQNKLLLSLEFEGCTKALLRSDTKNM